MTRITDKRLAKALNDEIGQNIELKTSNCHYSARLHEHFSQINPRLIRLPSYVIEVKINGELWKTFWINRESINYRILENFSSLTDRQKWEATEKNYSKPSSLEDLIFNLKEIKKTIFN